MVRGEHDLTEKKNLERKTLMREENTYERRNEIKMKRWVVLDRKKKSKF